MLKKDVLILSVLGGMLNVLKTRFSIAIPTYHNEVE